MIHVRKATLPDARLMAELLNGIIRKGGSTALTEEAGRDTLEKWMSSQSQQSIWHLAEDETGFLLGFQAVTPHDRLPPEACDIASFVRLGRTGLGVGSRLFEATATAARALGYRWINATIRADNPGGLAYYQSRGFEAYHIDRDVILGNGLVVDKISKRFVL